jgi:hypothetical protein
MRRVKQYGALSLDSASASILPLLRRVSIECPAPSLQIPTPGNLIGQPLLLRLKMLIREASPSVFRERCAAPNDKSEIKRHFSKERDASRGTARAHQSFPAALAVRGISAARQKLWERYFCDRPVRRKVRLVQNENSPSLATEPPAVAVLTLINLALLSCRHTHRTIRRDTPVPND